MPPLAAARRLSDSSGAEHPPRDHVVQFYEDDDVLSGSVATFIEEGLAQEQPVVIIATEQHREAFCRALRGRGVDVDGACSSGRLVLRDARKALATFLVDGKPDRELFRSEIGGIIASVATRHGPAVRAYGEMVDLLWKEGRQNDAIRLEELWNELRETHSFALLCAYATGNFYKEVDERGLRSVCAVHSNVDAGSESRVTEVRRLQRRTRALEREIERRKELERELRVALAERRRLEEELKRQNEDLLRTVRFSEMFVGILGHDLRNPLSGITTAASLLGRRADSEKVARPAARILSSAARMARMIDQLLDFTRIRLGEGLRLSRSENDLVEVCRMAIDELDGDAARVELHASGDAIGFWDGDRLLQVISNLVGNALAHGTRTAPVDVIVDGSAAGEVKLEVKNAGMIPEPVQALIFEPFRSGKDRKEDQSSGLGLGLYITRQIVLAHSGAIEVLSTREEGTCFTVWLPRAASAR